MLYCIHIQYMHLSHTQGWLHTMPENWKCY